MPRMRVETACCVAAGEDGVEGRAIFMETDDDDDCKDRMIRSGLRTARWIISTCPHSI
jgi:hypothetical protein